MVGQIQAWDRQARHGPAPTFAYWPSGHTGIPEDAAVMEKTHGTVTISWPAAD
jgi:protein-L-isoaspartate(D-aspartate) O-methyltransferase